MTPGIGGIDPLHLLRREAHGNDLLDQGDAQRLLEREDNDEIGDVDPIVPALHRLRHDFGANIIIDGGRSDELLLLQLRGEIIQILPEKGDHLFHIESEVRDVLPLRQTIIVQIVLPAPEFAGYQVPVVSHGRHL